MGRNVTDVGLEKTERRAELKKHAATIHCSNSLSLLQRKISNALLYHAYEELMAKEEHEITVKQLCRLIGYQGNNHAAIKDALKELISTIIEWNIVDAGNGAEIWTASSIIASVSLDGPVCYYAYSPRMKQLLHSPSMFGKIDLVIQSRFRSSYGLALYENCIRYRGLPHTKWFEMDLFKKLMGVPPGMYDVFRDFKRRVLDKAVNEVNTYSDLVIAAEFVKEGRKVVKVRFTLKERAKKARLGTKSTLPKLTDKSSTEELNVVLVDSFGLSAEQAEQLLSEHDADFIREKIAVIQQSKSYQEGRVENLAGYLLTAVKQNYQPSKSRKVEIIQLQDVKQEMELAELKRKAEMIRHDYNQYREGVIHATIENLPEADKSAFMQQFTLFAEPVIQTILQLQRRKYSRETVFESPQIKSLMRQFALRELEIITLISVEEFVSQQHETAREAWHKLKACDPEHAVFRLE